MAELLELSKDRSRFDVLVVESSGISEPLPVAEVFTMEQEGTGKRLSDYAHLDTTVTLVDAYNFGRDYTSPDTLASRNVAAFAGDERGVVDLLVDQVEFADVIVVNKTDLVSPGELQATLAVLRRLNPSARLIPAHHAAVPLASVLLTGAFSMERAAAAPGWLKELRGAHVPESVEYGITSFVFRARRPFHAARLMGLIRGGSGGPLRAVVRSKGFAWLAVDGGMDEVALVSQAGRVWQLSQGRAWWATVPRKRWPRGLAAMVAAEGKWDDTYGDRATELVVIGRGMARGEVEAALRGALVDDAEWAAGPAAWDLMEDPFDFFPYEDEVEGGEGEEEGSDGGAEEGGGGGGGHAHGGGGGGGGDSGHVHGEHCNHDEEPPRPTTCRVIVET